MSSHWTLQPGLSGAYRFKFSRPRGLTLLLACLFLNSCGYISGNASQNSPDNAPPAGSSPATIAPMTGPPGSTGPLSPGQSGRPLGPDGMPLLEAKGVNYTQLFSESLSDPDARFNRVETAVTELRRDFETVLPSILRLVAVEKDIQELTSQLQILLQNEPPPLSLTAVDEGTLSPVPTGAAVSPSLPLAASAVPPSPASMPVAQSPPRTATASAGSFYGSVPPPSGQQALRPQQAAAPGASGNPEIVALRLGQNGDKTRLVFDGTAPLSYRQDLDNSENLLLVELPGVRWAGPQQGKGGSSSLVSSWSVQPMENGAGSRAVIVLKRTARIADAMTMKPGGGSPHHRVVIDIAPGG